MKFLFIIQGEGRGHMTQAISLWRILRQEGHSLEKVYVGRSPGRELPSFLTQEFGELLNYFRSPNFSRTRNLKGIRPGLSILLNLFLAPVFIREVFRLRRHIKDSEADVVVNFYDIIGGLSMYRGFTGKKYFVISHHYYFEHPDFKWPERKRLMRFFLLLHNYLCSINANAKLALSYNRHENLTSKNIIIVPPLLRQKLFTIKPMKKDYIFVYLLNEGYLDDVSDWCNRNRDKKVVVFTNSGIKTSLPSNLELLELNGDLFLEKMNDAGAVVCTAGFETVCEAAFLGKRILVIPSEKHFEQLCNAHDSEDAGFTKLSLKFLPESLENEIPIDKLMAYRQWCIQSGEIFVKILCS